MNGIILINAFSGIGAHQAKRLNEEFSALGYNVPIVRNLPSLIPEKLDFCIFLDKDIYTAKMLENRGVKLFNSSSAIEACDDKMLTYIALNGKVNEPLTIPSAFSYTQSEVEEEELNAVVSALSLPLVMKINKHSRGEGVFLVKSKEELKELICRYRTTPHLYQKYISYASGKDIRAIVIGGKVVASMERYNEKDFRSNVEQGGLTRVVELSDGAKNIAEQVSKTLGLDYCGVDLLTDKDGTVYVCEVNSNAFFKGIEGATKVNVAKLFAEHVLKFF